MCTNGTFGNIYPTASERRSVVVAINALIIKAIMTIKFTS
jgi:hypothetical protein